MQNTNIFLKSRGENGLKSGRLACLLACPLCAGVQGAGASGGLSWCVPCFYPLSRFARGGLLANVPLFAILRAF